MFLIHAVWFKWTVLTTFLAHSNVAMLLKFSLEGLSEGVPYTFEDLPPSWESQKLTRRIVIIFRV